MDGFGFQCPACGGRHFGRDTARDCDSVMRVLATVRCNDEFGVNCRWHGTWPQPTSVRPFQDDEANAARRLLQSLWTLCQYDGGLQLPPGRPTVKNRQRAVRRLAAILLDTENPDFE